mmetsp:Transcript_94961/g.307174  ORF Transcript_94961/g.307174 Transcript_94961/m.307174 type:complete len:275 (+) Transcript_94961:390-1214(+)
MPAPPPPPPPPARRLRWPRRLVSGPPSSPGGALGPTQAPVAAPVTAPPAACSEPPGRPAAAGAACTRRRTTSRQRPWPGEKSSSASLSCRSAGATRKARSTTFRENLWPASCTRCVRMASRIGRQRSPPPLVQGVLHGVVPVGALRQVDRMTRELAEKALLTRAKSALRDALLQDAQAVRTVGDNAKGHRNLLENGVGAQIAEAHQGALHHVRAIRVTAQLHDVLPQRRDQQVPLLLRADEADQGLHRMRAPLVGGHGGQVLQSYLEHAHPLTN